MSTKRNALTLRHKVDLMKAAESGKSCHQLADDFYIGRTQASSILKRKAKLLPRSQTQAVEDWQRRRERRLLGVVADGTITKHSHQWPDGPGESLRIRKETGEYRVESVERMAGIVPQATYHRRLPRYTRGSCRRFPCDQR